MNIQSICNRIIEYSFYTLFFFVPLAFFGNTSELFEFNKMWLTFGLTIIIAGAWGTKMVLNREFRVQKTPLDLPLLLFLLSQAISTFYSLDMHTSLWGYYSRFNGGLFSLTAYIFLYYAFVSNFLQEGVAGEGDPHRAPAEAKRTRTSDGERARQDPVIAKRMLFVSLAAGAVVTLWGLPSHFGYDPTCFLFRGTFDVSCWTEGFQPKIRIFSTLGQPNWLAAYLAILLPLSIAMFLKNFVPQTTTGEKNNELGIMNNGRTKNSLLYSLFFILYSILLFVAILYTGSRSGFYGLLGAAGIFFLLCKQKVFLLKFVFIPLLILSLFLGTPIDQQVKQFTTKFLPKLSPSSTTYNLQPTTSPVGTALETGGTESGIIRLIVWRGAIDAWMHNPIFGTGVETFAYAYYKYRPAAHNMTSEWDYLYNKAHNEYLNYLATTGIFGLGSYLAIIGTFLFVSLRNHKSQITNHKQISNTNNQNYKNLEFENWSPTGMKIGILELALTTSYISILISNFLGFSVVIINIYFFLIPAFVFILSDVLSPERVFSFSWSKPAPKNESRIMNNELGISVIQWILIAAIILASLFLIQTLYRFWDADLSYARGYNLDRAGQYEYAYYDLLDAVEKRPSEPTFIDELSYNTGVLAATLLASKDSVSASDSAKVASYAAKLTQDTLLLSNKNTIEHPNNVVFWKTKIRIFNLLGQQDAQFVPLALDAAQKTAELAPTDAKVWYSLGILYGQNNEKQQAINTLLRTVQLKPDYRDAYYALALFYHDTATDKNNKVIHPDLQEKANETMQYIVDHIATDDPQVIKALGTWKK